MLTCAPQEENGMHRILTTPVLLNDFVFVAW